MRLRWKIAAAAMLAGLVAGAAAAERKPPVPVDRDLPVRGAAMHFRVYPGDARTILLESGSGLGSATWDDLAPRLAARTGATVISYDRAGMGSSVPLTTPYDVHEEVARLHAGLHALGRDRGLVLVGHSYGGYLIQLYANLYPGDVRGMVYVDANTVKGIDGIGGARILAEGRIKANDVPDPTPYQRANLRLSRALEQTHETMRRYPPLCGVPVIVMTAGRDWPKTPPERVEGWRAGHRELVAMTGGRAVIATQAGHMLHRDQPQLVIDAAADVLRRSKVARPVIGTPGVPCPR